MKSTTRNSDESARWSELMALAQRGDAEAFRELLLSITPRLVSFCSKLLRGDTVAEDVVQEILITIHKSRHVYDPNQSFANWMYIIARHKVIDFQRSHAKYHRNVEFDETLVTSPAVSAYTGQAHSEQTELERRTQKTADNVALFGSSSKDGPPHRELKISRQGSVNKGGTSHDGQLPEQAEEPKARIDQVASALRELKPEYRDALTMTKIEGYSVRDTAQKLGMSEASVKVRVHRAIKMIIKKVRAKS